MTVTNEILAGLVAVNLFVMGINVKFLFALWNDLKTHKDKYTEDMKEIRDKQFGNQLNAANYCREAQEGCRDKILILIKEEAIEAKTEARIIAEDLRKATDRVSQEYKLSEEIKYKEFKAYGIELRQQLYQHTHDDDGKAVIK